MTRRCMEIEEYWRDLGGPEASNNDGPVDQFEAAWKALTDAELVDMIRFCQGFAPPRPGGVPADDAPSPYTSQNRGLLDMIKQRARDFWAHREDARADLRSQLQAARSGTLGKTELARRSARDFVRAMDQGEVDDIYALAPLLDSEAFLVGYEGAMRLREAGEFDLAYALIQRFTSHFQVYAHDHLPLGPSCGRWGTVVQESLDSHWPCGPFSTERCQVLVAPRRTDFDWTPYDHVIGLGTTITHAVLTALGVPRHKQHIVEVHRNVPYAVGREFPRLQGKVAIVDDVHQGETSLYVARLYDADVIAIHIWDYHYLDLYKAPLPLCTLLAPECIDQGTLEQELPFEYALLKGDLSIASTEVLRTFHEVNLPRLMDEAA